MTILAVFAFGAFAVALVLFARLNVLVFAANSVTMTFVDEILAILCTSSLIGTANTSTRAAWRLRSVRLAVAILGCG